MAVPSETEIKYAPQHAKVLRSPLVPDFSDLFAWNWDYLYLGYDCAVLDWRMFRIAAEYGGREKPDLMIFSSPGSRFATCAHSRPNEIFHLLCEMAKKGVFQVWGNKFLSRALLGRAVSGRENPSIEKVFMKVKTLLTLSHPWVEAKELPSSCEIDLFTLADNFTH